MITWKFTMSKVLYEVVCPIIKFYQWDNTDMIPEYAGCGSTCVCNITLHLSMSLVINISATTEFKTIYVQPLTTCVQPFKCQVLCCGQNTIQFKYPLRDRLLLFGQKVCRLLGTTLTERQGFPVWTKSLYTSCDNTVLPLHSNLDSYAQLQ
jgi:ferredoxin-like protein FixX